VLYPDRLVGIGIPELLIAVFVAGGAWLAFKGLRIIVRGLAAAVAEGVEQGRQAARPKDSNAP
jgi:predicted DNA repair protein MutK